MYLLDKIAHMNDHVFILCFIGFTVVCGVVIYRMVKWLNN